MTGPFGTTPGPWTSLLNDRGDLLVMFHDIDFGRDFPVTSRGLVAAENNNKAMAQVPAMLALVQAVLDRRNFIDEVEVMARDIARELEVK